MKTIKTAHNNSLILLVHGLHGSDHDFDFLAETLEQERNIISFRSTSNTYSKTLDGIEMMARRLLDEFLDVVADMDLSAADHRLNLSVLGHSLGGLIAWYFVNLLLDPFVLTNKNRLLLKRQKTNNGSDGVAYDVKDDDLAQLMEDEKLIARRDQILARVIIVPCAFYTHSSPILGARRAPSGEINNTLLSWLPGFFIPFITNNVVPLTMGKTGQELFMNDQDKLLFQLTRSDGPYMQTLAKFKTRTLMGHVQDFTVPLESAICMPHHTFESDLHSTGFKVIYSEGFTRDHHAASPLLGDDELPQHHVYIERPKSAGGESTLKAGSNGKASRDRKRSQSYTCQMSQGTSTKELYAGEFEASSNWLSGKTIRYHKHQHDPVKTSNLTFRRAVFDFGVQNPIDSLLVHATSVGKRMNFTNAQARQCADEGTRWLAALIKKDFEMCRNDDCQ